MSWLRRRREEPKVDLTSMVDVVFLLLIFFMISTTFVANPGITVKLPEAGAQREAAPPKEIKVYLSAAGEIAMDGHPLSLDALRAKLAGYRQEAGRMTFVLYADTDSRHGRVVELMDLAREAGFGKLAIGTEARPPGHGEPGTAN